MSDDLIKRSDAIETAYQLRRKPNDEEWAEWLRSFNAIPSAGRPQEWIPCSERVPKWKEHTDDMVLVCYADGSVRFNTCISGEWVQGEPIAWMPLPETWKGADDE